MSRLSFKAKTPPDERSSGVELILTSDLALLLAPVPLKHKENLSEYVLSSA